MPGSFATTAIITKGLHGQSALRGIITTHFSLYIEQLSPVNPIKYTGGGPYPGPAWNKVDNIKDFFKPVDVDLPQTKPLLAPVENITPYTGRGVAITFKVNLGSMKMERIYTVPEHRKHIVIRVFGLLDATRAKMSLIAKNLKTVSSRTKIFVKNLVVKRKKPNK